MAISSAQNSAVGSVEFEAIGKAAATNSMMRELGGVFGIAIVVAVFAAAGSYASSDTFVDGFAPADRRRRSCSRSPVRSPDWLFPPSQSGGQPMKQVMVRYKVRA